MKANLLYRAQRPSAMQTAAMDRLPIDQLRVVVLGADGVSGGNSKGRLFEAFVARLLNKLGYEKPTTSNLNVTSAGIELDVATRHQLTGTRLIAECKAYSTNVPAHMLDAFFGKLARERFSDPGLQGLFVALPRLTSNGEEQARSIEAEDMAFRYLNSERVAAHLQEQGQLPPLRDEIGLTSDPMILLTEHGVYQAALRLDPNSRTADAVVLWASGGVPDAVRTIVRHSAIADGLPVVAVGEPVAQRPVVDEPVIARVAASTSDFHYQLPAAPKFFVGRRDALADLEQQLLSDSPGVVVFNAQSGWGKSSLALRVGRIVEKGRGRALILDARTASSPSFVPAAIRELAEEASRARIVKLGPDAAFGTISSSLRSLAQGEWATPRRPLLLFFDQFENVFRDAALTRSFRDLALAVRDVPIPLKIGFAWKTDLVGWTEGHPYQLRDEIRGAGDVVVLEPLGPADVSTLLTRLQRTVGQRLDRDLRDRLREYSGGLPWLFKKLAGHVIDELAAGSTQADLLAEALNVQGLFDADLAELSPGESAALREIARLAPVPVSELSDSVEMPIVQSLLDRRLIVQVGERLDTYWDIFRDYLNTGVVPIKDAFILRLNPAPAMGLILRTAIEQGGAVSTTQAMAVLRTSEAVVFNTVRDLRLLGLVTYEPGEIRVTPDALGGEPEEALQARASAALRRHRAFELVSKLLDESPIVTFSEFAEQLAAAFPAVTAKSTTWDQYGRAFAYWFAYAGLVGLTAGGMTADPDDTHIDLALLSRLRRVSVSDAFPQSAAGPAIELGEALARGTTPNMPATRQRRAVSALEALGLLTRTRSGDFTVDATVFTLSGVDRIALRATLETKVPGASEAIGALVGDPATPPTDIGLLLREAQQTSWTPTSTHNAGKHFRSWAREAGVRTSQRRGPRRDPSAGLFDGDW